MLKLEEIQVDTHVSGIEPFAPVKILYVKKGADAFDVTYELLARTPVRIRWPGKDLRQVMLENASKVG